MGAPRRRFAFELLAILAAGALVHAWIVASTPGEYWDIDAIRVAGSFFAHSPLHVYTLNVTRGGSYQGVPTYVWPYPPAFLPIIAAMHWIAFHGGPTVSHLDRAFMSMTDLSLAFVLQWGLGRMGYSHRRRLAAAALVALGPAFVAVAAVHGQLDAFAWLPAAGAFILWARRRKGWHALACGVLIGLGIDVKVAPGLALLALGPDARDRRELLSLLAGAAGVVLLSLVPFALTTTSGLSAITHYSGFPGRGGLTSLLQPRLTLHLLAPNNPNIIFNGTTHFLLGHSALILVPLLVGVAAVARWRRLEPPDTMVALILTLCVFAPAVLPQYWLWPVPFLILGGRLWAAFIFQLAALPLLIWNYAFLVEPYQPHRYLSVGFILHVYVPYLWAFTVALLVALLMLLFGPFSAAVVRRRPRREVSVSA